MTNDWQRVIQWQIYSLKSTVIFETMTSDGRRQKQPLISNWQSWPLAEILTVTGRFN